MSGMVLTLAAGAEGAGKSDKSEGERRDLQTDIGGSIEELPSHSYPGKKKTQALPEESLNPDAGDKLTAGEAQIATGTDHATTDDPEVALRQEDRHEQHRQRATYRGRTVTMLRRYMRYSIETGRLPSLLGREFFRAKVTSYTVVTFEDRVIFVHDMETCLDKLDEFSRQIIGRHILQEHDQAETARLLNCSERTIRTYTPMALDLLSDILLEVGLLAPIHSVRRNSCQEGENDGIPLSDCERGRNKV